MEIILKELEAKLKSAVERLREELRGIRSNRPPVGLVEEIKVDYYGQEMPVKQLASLSVRPPRDIEVSVWDKGAMGAVAKAIETAKAGFSVSNEGTIIRVSIPTLTDERRAELSKLVKKMIEESRIYVRNERDECMKRLKSEEDSGRASEDQVFRAKERAQKIVEEANKGIEELLSGKLKEIAE